MALVLWCKNPDGTFQGDGGPLVAISGDVILSELGQMNGFSVILPATSERAILAMAPFTEIELEQTGDGVWGVGTIQRAIVKNPRQAITDRDDDTITLELMPLTDELTDRLTHRGWIAEGFLSTIHSRLVSIRPGWTGVYTGDPTDPVTGGDFLASVNLNNPTVLAGDLDTGKKFGQFVRQGVDANGVPTRILEMGQFGAAPTITIQDPKGGSAEEMVNNLTVRPAVTIERTPNDVTSLVNVCTPFGGGSSTDSLVTLERCWRIVNDPTYINAGRYGPDAESMARTGMATVLNGDNPPITALPMQAAATYSSTFLGNIPLGTNVSFLSTAGGWSHVVYNGVSGYVDARYLVSSLFPEYDDNYPISDPDNLPTGQIQYLFTDIYGNVFSPALASAFTVAIGARRLDGIVPLIVSDGSGLRPDVTATFMQGAYNTRFITNDGHFDYMMFDRVSLALYPHKQAESIDSSLTYSDPSIANQELTERALYVSTKTNFLRRSHPHHTFSCTAPGTGRPTRAGDLIAIDVQRVNVGIDDAVAVVEMDVQTNLKVIRVTRSFNGDNPPVDTYVVSNVGRFEDDDNTAAASQAQTMISLQRNQATGPAPLPIFGRGNADALHPLVVKIPIPAQLYRWYACSLGFDFLPYSATSTTAVNHDGTAIVTVGDVEILIPARADINALAAAIGGMPEHYHRLKVEDKRLTYSIPFVPINESPDGYVWFEATSGNPRSNGRAGFWITSDQQTTGIDFEPSKHPHVVAKAGDEIAHIPPGQTLAHLPAHTHPLDQRIPDGPTFPSISIDIDGLLLSSGIKATSGASNPFTSGAFIADVNVGGSVEKPGQVLTLTFTPGTSASNPYGVGYLVVYGTWYGEFGGFASVVRAQ